MEKYNLKNSGKQSIAEYVSHRVIRKLKSNGKYKKNFQSKVNRPLADKCIGYMRNKFAQKAGQVVPMSVGAGAGASATHAREGLWLGLGLECNNF